MDKEKSIQQVLRLSHKILAIDIIEIFFSIQIYLLNPSDNRYNSICYEIKLELL